MLLRQKKSEARDFLATGGACGIAAAFRAPLSGVLFVVEEASSRTLKFGIWSTLFSHVLSATSSAM